MSGYKERYLSEGLLSLLVSYYNKDVFSAASLAYYSSVFPDNEDSLVSCGTTGRDGAEKVSPATLFDLASLTKPLVTALCVLSLIDSKKLAWDDPLGSLLDIAVPEPLQAINIYSLLSHSSGLPAHRNFWKTTVGEVKNRRNDCFLQETLQQEEEYPLGSKHLYSDLGYILLGSVVEQKTGKNLDRFWSEIVAEPLEIKKDLFFPERQESKYSRSYAATGICQWSGEILQGVVHDDNCRSSGGVCGHAGLFGNAPAVLVLCKELLALYKGQVSRLPISTETFRFACRRVGMSEWTAGFNLPSEQGSSTGAHFSPGSIGHLGFTGTSFWIDLQKELIVILLTNRVIAGDDQKGIKELRPAIHDYLVEYLQKNQ